MDVKLTLKLDADVIARAKEYAKEHDNSLSRIVENYLKSILQDKEIKEAITISPKVLKMTTGAKSKLPNDFDYKKEYGDYLSKKYLSD